MRYKRGTQCVCDAICVWIGVALTFLRALTDSRVRQENAPFDHPSLAIENGGMPGIFTTCWVFLSSTIGCACLPPEPPAISSPSGRPTLRPRTSCSR